PAGWLLQNHAAGQTTITLDAFGPDVPFPTAREAETEITGPLAATLTVSTSTTDADIFATVQAFLADGTEIIFEGASEAAAPLAQGWLRLSHRRTDPARSRPYQPFHPPAQSDPAAPGQPYEVDTEIWPTSIVLPARSTLSLTISGRDFARGATGTATSASELTGRGSGLFIHCDPADRPAPAFSGHTT